MRTRVFLVFLPGGFYEDAFRGAFGTWAEALQFCRELKEEDCEAYIRVKILEVEEYVDG